MRAAGAEFSKEDSMTDLEAAFLAYLERKPGKVGLPAEPPPPEPAPPGKAPPKLHEIMAAVCHVTGIRREVLISQSRRRNTTRARQLYFWIARKHTRKSYFAIGQSCGGKDHSTVMHGVRKIDSLYSDHAEDIARIRAAMGIGRS